MIETFQRRMIGHGALILLGAMVAGCGLLVSLLGGIELWPGRITPLALGGDGEAWRHAHLGGLLNGLLLLGIALAMPVLRFAPGLARQLCWMMIGTGWANTLFYWAAIVAPNRALSFAANRFGESSLAGIIGLAPALLFVIVSMFATGLVVRQAFRTQAREPGAPADA